MFSKQIDKVTNTLAVIRRFNLNSLKRKLRHFQQRRKWGFDDSDTWSLDYTIAKFALPRLRRFKEMSYGYPYNLTPEEWDKKLDDIEFFLQEIIRNCEKGPRKMSDEESKRYKNGKKCWGKYFDSLWW